MLLGPTFVGLVLLKFISYIEENLPRLAPFVVLTGASRYITCRFDRYDY